MNTPDWVQTLFNLLAQFTGGRGGIDHVIVNFGIAAMFWAILLLVALAKRKSNRQPRESLLIWGFSFGLARDLLMLGMAVTVALGFIKNETLHIVFPPLEHALSNLAQVVVAAAFLLFLTRKSEITKRFLVISAIAIGGCYLATAWWWAEFIIANPTAKFGQVWCDWLFRIVASALLAWPIWFMWTNSQGRSRNVVVTALSFFFLHEFLKIPDMALGEVYESMFAPIRHGLYLAAIPMFGYIYVREQADELQHTLENLEGLVEMRTQELEAALIQVNTEMKKKEQTVDELEAFAYSVAHDLKSPLLGMGGVSTALLEDYGSKLDETGNENLQYIEQESSRLGLLIDDLLAYSRFGRGALDFELIDLTHVLSKVKTGLRGNIEASSASIHIKGEIPLIFGNSTTLEMMLQNLLANAIKFSQPGKPPVIAISAEKTEESVVLSISDNGIGMDAQSQANIFDIFHRLNTDIDYEGTGIGLAIVKKAVELHSGSIWIKSEKNQGSTFFIKLPTEPSSMEFPIAA